MTDVAADSRPFDLCGVLPTGVTVLEASAGTGKTFTIAALAARYVAEGTPLNKLLLVTFTRMATGELRNRVRERLLSSEQGLSRAVAGVFPDDRDEVVKLLADGPQEQVKERRDRLRRALANFDAATIATTHGFCQEVLAGLGVAGDVDPEVTFVEDVGDLVDEIVDDLYLRRFHRDDMPAFDHEQALLIARSAIANPATPIEPKEAPKDSIAAMRCRLAQVAREEFERRKRRMAVMTYDDLLTRLNDTLKGPGGPGAAARLQARHDVVLVDEFQDTDPVQWEILRRAFAERGVTLVLIADPKQAIYAFRGADVYAYLEAAKAADTRATLQVNWRSDQGLLDAYDAMFSGAKLGHEGIAYRTVRAAEANRTPRLSGAPVAAPMRLRLVHRDEPGITLTRAGYASRPSAREHIAADLAGDLVALLASGAEIETRPEDGAPPERQRVCPGHLAVLVRTHRTAELVRDALDAVAIPAVINGAGSVFGTAPARDWLRLLEALERPTSAQPARSAALTSFLGWSTEQVAGATEAEWEKLHQRLHQWARILRLRGVASLTETITLVEGLPGRVLGAVDGERRLTDLRHVAQLLHGAASEQQMGATALTSWLRQRVNAADQETGDEQRSRRLESDAEAVQVLTIHRSKGLEFPIVYCPYLWEPSFIPSGPQPVCFHDPEAGDTRTLDVGMDGPNFPRHREQYETEERGEDLRLAYVALTRAKHQAVIWWAGSWDSRNSALGRLLFARDDDGTVAPAGTFTPTDSAALARFEGLAARAPGCISVERSTVGNPVKWSGAPSETVTLSAARFGRSLDVKWRRTSYSDITAGTYEPWVASEPEIAATSDEPPPPAAPAADPRKGASDNTDAEALRAVPSILSEMPAGVRIGTFVHRVLEATDYAAPDLDSELARHIAVVQTGWQVDIGNEDLVHAGLSQAIEAPLGLTLDDVRLRDLRREDRLDELNFELPLVGGDEPTGSLTLSAISDVLCRHVAPGDALHGYADRLDGPALRQNLRGYLTGSIDLVARVRDAGGTPRFAVIDYKTNWLGAPGEELSAWHYRPAALAAEMTGAHYALQALLYTVALHRYLRWRVADYDPEHNLAGVLYLFLRGMTGPRTPTVAGTRCGVFAWKPSKPLVEELSDVLDRGTSS